MMDIPVSTYRFQFSPSFTFSEAARAVPYLARLGVSHVYASPVFAAREGSSHGYDVVDPLAINSEIGSREQMLELARELKARGIGWVQDIVPNHMAFSSANRMLGDVLERREHSPYFNFFDIEWDHPYESLKGKLLAPFLGSFYSEALERGEIGIVYENGALSAAYYDHRFPLLLQSCDEVFARDLSRLEQALGATSSEYVKYLGAVRHLRTLAGEAGTGEQIAYAKESLRRQYDANGTIREYVDTNLAAFSARTGGDEALERLDVLLARQAFRLSFWKVAAEEINYRRFFSINDLICLRAERREVFDHIHRLIFDMVGRGVWDGLRVDHIDGLLDPYTYLDRLRRACPESWLVVEKILDRHEHLPPHWPVQGTTGYDFMNLAAGLFCRKEAEKDFTRMYARRVGRIRPYPEVLAEKKRLILGKHMAGNIDNLAQLLKRIAAGERHGRDITLYALRRALVEVLVYFPVYRTYVNRERFDEQDRGYLKEAVDTARRAHPDLEYELDFIADYLLHLDGDDRETPDRQRILRDYVMEFQQHTGPLMAKGCEDTVFYVYNKLVSLNEVGGNPSEFGVSIEEFHRANEERCRTWPHTMNATATHDTKRGEDARLRINVLTEIPGEWRSHVGAWARLNRHRKSVRQGARLPDANDEYFFYQTLIGTYPFSDEELPAYRKRLSDYVVKAVREAKVHTAWVKPDSEYEGACVAFVSALLDTRRRNRFLESFLPLQRKVAFYAMFHSLSQVLLKATSPGVPDFYRGNELWDFSMVDPDNRRPVDVALRERLLSEIIAGYESDAASLSANLLEHASDGRIKLFLTWRCLQARRNLRDLFTHGEYLPLEVEGRHRERVVAFARRNETQWAITLAPRLLCSVVDQGRLPLGYDVWADTACVLPEGAGSRWKNQVGGEEIVAEGRINLGVAFARFPAALLFGERAG